MAQEHPQHIRFPHNEEQVQLLPTWKMAIVQMLVTLMPIIGILYQGFVVLPGGREMEDIALKWISTLGFPIFSACALAWALLRIFSKYENATNESKQIALVLHKQAIEQVATMNEALSHTADKMSQVATSLDKNVKATEANTEYLKKFGSDPMGLCKIEEAKRHIIEHGFKCPSDNKIQMIFDKIAELKEKKDRDKVA